MVSRLPGDPLQKASHFWGGGSVCPRDAEASFLVCQSSMYIARTSKNAPFCFKFFKISRGSMPPDPPRRVWAQPKPNWLQKLQ